MEKNDCFLLFLTCIVRYIILYRHAVQYPILLSIEFATEIRRDRQDFCGIIGRNSIPSIQSRFIGFGRGRKPSSQDLLSVHAQSIT